MLVLCAVLACIAGAQRIRTYTIENATWSTAHGMLLGHTPGPLPGDDDATTDADLVRDDFSVDRGPVSLCHWDDQYARWAPWVAQARSVARRRHWAPGIRARLKLDPSQPSVCRPAYGWPEFVRLELTGYVLLALLLAGSALFLGMARRR